MNLRDKHNQATIEDHSGSKHEILLDVNWDPELSDYIKMDFNGEIAFIKKADMFAFMFVLATPEQQDLLVPVRKDEMRPYDRQHRVIVQKDLKAGEEVIVNCKIHVPTIIDASIREELKKEAIDNSLQKIEEGL
jgi:hypothetical protein